MKKEDARFELVYCEGSSLERAGSSRILRDRNTGVHYLLWSNGYAGGITPLLDGEGKPIIEK